MVGETAERIPKAAGIERFLKRLKLNPPASDAAIGACERHFGVTFPEEYVRFLRLANGGEGWINENAWLSLWDIEEMVSRNELYEIADEPPGLLAFGNDGGDTVYAFDLWTPNWWVLEHDFVSSWRDDSAPLATCFARFLELFYEIGGTSSNMALSELTRCVSLIDGRYSIYAAKPWTPGSVATLLLHKRKVLEAGFCYPEDLPFFLTVAHAQGCLAALLAVESLSVQERCRRLIAEARQHKEP